MYPKLIKNTILKKCIFLNDLYDLYDKFYALINIFY